MWLESVYESNPQGLHDVWVKLIAAMETCSMGGIALDVMEAYKVLVPSSLSAPQLDKVMTFCSHNSRPITCKGLSKDRCGELLGTLLNHIHVNFRACTSPKNFLVRADANKKESEILGEQRVMLVGASNLNHSVKFFETHGMPVADATQPGWVALAENVKRLAGEVEAAAPATAAFVFDLLGNSSVRFEQYDGTMALPFKSNGKFHLGGKIVTTPMAVFRQIIDSVIPIIKAKGAKPAVIIPPLPRYLFSRCCRSLHQRERRKLQCKTVNKFCSTQKRTDQTFGLRGSNKFQSYGFVLCD
jgi:hypothetical protein